MTLSKFTLLRCLLFLAAAIVRPCMAQEPGENGSGHTRLWKISLASVAAASVLDVHSSYGKIEGNRLLAGPGAKFGARAAGIKLSILGGSMAGQHRIGRRSRRHRTMAVVNFVVAGALTAVAAHNYSLGPAR